MDAALTRLKSGSLDYMEVLQPVQVVRGTNSERFKREFKKYEYYAPTYTYIGWNNDHPIFRDKRVRQAMTYLTDRKLIVKACSSVSAKWSTARFIFSGPSTTKI